MKQTQTEYSTGRELFDATVDDHFATEADISKSIADILSEEALTEGVDR